MFVVARIALQCVATYIIVRAGVNLADAYIFTDKSKEE